MKKYYVLLIYVTVILFCYVTAISAQKEWFNPLNWAAQVNDVKKNPKILHKLYVQGFDEDDEGLLDYKVSGKHDFIIPKEYDIKGGSETRAIRLYPGSKLVFDVPDFGKRVTTYFEFPFAFISPKVKEDIIFISQSYINPEPRTNRPCIIHKEDRSGYFYERKTNDRKCLYKSPILNPSRLEISIGKTTGTLNGFYCIDSIFLFVDIPDFSLLQKSGNWHDNSLWSHLYPKDQRKALINSDVVIDSPADCEQIITNQKEIKIVDSGNLKVGKMSVLYEFPEKGKWYFVAFPFDIYPEDLDSCFQVGDKSTVTSDKVNNILYACKYDGRRRAETNLSNGNWSVIPIEDVVSGEVLFHKGVGYLLAIDQTADKQLLTFSSSSDTELIFTPEETLSIKADELQTGSDDNNGWVLCGNPYTSALLLSDISPNLDLDGNVYLFDGENYQSYPIGSDWSIPAQSPFFVKAKRNTQLIIKKTSTENLNLLRSAGPFSKSIEPSIAVTSKEKIQLDNDLRYRIYPDFINVFSKAEGYYYLYNLFGELMDKEKLLSGENKYILPSEHGTYLIRIVAGKDKRCIKLVH